MQEQQALNSGGGNNYRVIDESLVMRGTTSHSGEDSKQWRWYCVQQQEQ